MSDGNRRVTPEERDYACQEKAREDYRVAQVRWGLDCFLFWEERGIDPLLPRLWRGRARPVTP